VSSPARRSTREAGLSYVEVLVAVMLLAVCLAPALSALSTGALGAQVHAQETARNLRVASRLEELLAEPLAELDAAAQAAGSPTTATSYSDPAGTAERRLVYLARWDGDGADGDGNPFTGGDAGLIWIRVQVEGSPPGMESLAGP
jgi:Tfp pilus assembly protein PilV